MITLYDIPSKLTGNAFSTNTLKTRFAIGFKGLPFKTEWVEMGDIEPKMKELGAKPTSVKPDGSPMYTLPVIFDDATGKPVSDSMKIAEYLELTYSDKPSLFPFGLHAPIHLFNDHLHSTCIKPAVYLFAYAMIPKFTAPTLAFLRKSREPALKKTLEEMVPKGDERVAQLTASKAGFSKLAEIYASNGEGKPFFYGDVPSYADILVVSNLLWIKAGLGEENPEWKSIEGSDDGKWKDLLKLMMKYYDLA